MHFIPNNKMIPCFYKTQLGTPYQTQNQTKPKTDKQIHGTGKMTHGPKSTPTAPKDCNCPTLLVSSSVWSSLLPHIPSGSPCFTHRQQKASLSALLASISSSFVFLRTANCFSSMIISTRVFFSSLHPPLHFFSSFFLYPQNLSSK